MRRFGAITGALLVCAAVLTGFLYYRSPNRSLHSLARAIANHDLSSVERYADIAALGPEVQNAIRYHAMLATPRERWTAVNELAMNEAATGADFTTLAQKWIERVADTDSFSDRTLFLLDPHMSMGAVRRVTVQGDVATAIVDLRSTHGPVSLAISLRRRGNDWQVMDADLRAAEEALVKLRWAEVHQAFAAASH